MGACCDEGQRWAAAEALEIELRQVKPSQLMSALWLCITGMCTHSQIVSVAVEHTGSKLNLGTLVT